MHNGNVGYWFDEAGLDRTRASLTENEHADVVFVGAGFSSLWAAYYMAKANPSLRIVILEADFVGFGASGRNGGHLTHGLPGLERLYLKTHPQEKVDEFRQEIKSTIDEVIRVAEAEGIEADIVKGGTTAVARNAAQWARMRRAVENARPADRGGLELELLSADDLKRYVYMDGAVGGTWTPHSARIQPAKLAKRLGEVVEGLGVVIYEGTKVEVIEPGVVTTSTGRTIHARYIVRATEGFTPSIKGSKRNWLPKLSPQIITEPLSDEAIAEYWPSASMASDGGHMFCYLQKTYDNRIAIGGPGVPYYWGSRIDDRGHTERSSIRDLRRKLHAFFPLIADAEITHAWTGVLGVPRDWSATVSLNEYTGLGVIGGYVGTGVTGTNLAGRTMTDLIMGRKSQITTLPWVNKDIRNWEFEPVRWVALRGLYKAYVVADAVEDRSGGSRTSIIAKSANGISGRY